MDTSGRHDAVRRSYDAVAGEYAASFRGELDHKPLDRAMLTCLIEQAEHGAPLADLGCGPGHVTGWLARRGVAAVGIDLSAGMIAVARREHPEAEFRVGDLLGLPAGDGEFGAVAALYSIIHLEPGELPRAFAEIHRVVRPGGRALISFHLGSEVRHLAEWLGQEVDVDFRFREIPEVTAVMEHAGFLIEAQLERTKLSSGGSDPAGASAGQAPGGLTCRHSTVRRPAPALDLPAALEHPCTVEPGVEDIAPTSRAPAHCGHAAGPDPGRQGTVTEVTGPPSAAQPLFIMAMDQRDSFGTLFGVQGEATSAQLADMRSAKSLIFAAAQRLASTPIGGGRLGVLVDEQLGADVARQAKAAGFVLAMPVEASGAERLTFEYGDDFPQHVEAFDPDWMKVLVRFNPADPAELREAQTATLKRLNDYADRSRRRWMVELLVPATREQLAAHEDQALYDEQARPMLTVQVIHALTEAGVHPGIWKLEGYETTDGARLVLDAVQSSGHPESSCIVLGRNAPQRQVDHWLDIAAPLEGFVGFAVGRSNWREPIVDYLAGRVDRDGTEARIAEHYGHFIHEYLQADSAPRGEDESRTEPFSYRHPRLTPDREAIIRKACAGADPRGTLLPAWMPQSLLAEVDALRDES